MITTHNFCAVSEGLSTIINFINIDASKKHLSPTMKKIPTIRTTNPPKISTSQLNLIPQ